MAKRSTKPKADDDHQELLTVIPVCRKDYVEAGELIPWINELGGCKKHELLLFFSADVPRERQDELIAVAKHGWKKVHIGETPFCWMYENWPYGPNWMHFHASRWVMMNRRLPWLWLEPDCVPLKPGWLEALEQEYNDGFKPFMGVLEPKGSCHPMHVSGCRISPCDFHAVHWKAYEDISRPFDILDADSINNKNHRSDLFCFVYNRGDIAPRFLVKDDLKLISPKAVLFHRNKDGSLIKLLRGSLRK